MDSVTISVSGLLEQLIINLEIINLEQLRYSLVLLLVLLDYVNSIRK